MSLKPFLRNTSKLTLSEHDTVLRAIERMVEQRAGAILVTEQGRLKGIFSERDVMTRIVLESRDPGTTRLGTVMTADVTHATEDTSLNNAIRLMSERRIRHLPVVTAQGEILGMIGLRYLLHDRINELVGEIQALEGYLNDAPGG